MSKEPKELEELADEMAKAKIALDNTQGSYRVLVQRLVDARLAAVRRDYRSWLQRFDWSVSTLPGKGAGFKLVAPTVGNQKNREALRELIGLLADPTRDVHIHQTLGSVDVDDGFRFRFSGGNLIVSGGDLQGLILELGLSVGSADIQKAIQKAQDQIDAGKEELEFYTELLDTVVSSSGFSA